MEPLPNKLSALLRIAVEDAQKIEKTPGYRLSMVDWHVPGEEVNGEHTCHVCMAGAIMASRLGASRDADLAPIDMGEDEERALLAVDQMRTGRMFSAADYLALELTKKQEEDLYEIQSAAIDAYEASDEPHRAEWSDYLEMAARLEAVGL